jgi:hypothetical protein
MQSHVFSPGDALYTFWQERIAPEEHGIAHATARGKHLRFLHWKREVGPKFLAELSERLQKENVAVAKQVFGGFIPAGMLLHPGEIEKGTIPATAACDTCGNPQAPKSNLCESCLSFVERFGTTP